MIYSHILTHDMKRDNYVYINFFSHNTAAAPPPSPPPHLQPLPPPSPGTLTKKKKKKKKDREVRSPQLAPVAGPVPPHHRGLGGGYAAPMQPPPSSPHPSSASQASSAHSKQHPNSPRGARERYVAFWEVKGWCDGSVRGGGLNSKQHPNSPRGARER